MQLLAVGMMITGSLNTISESPAALARAPCCGSPPVEPPVPRLPPPTSTPPSPPSCALLAATKAADNFNTTDRYGNTVQFNHPFVQAACMFLGEMSNLIPFFILQWRSGASAQAKAKKPFNLMWLAIPAMCDLTATSTMYLGLGLTDASVFQMLRGSCVVFTAIFSVVFLKRKQYAFHWLGVGLVLVGTLIVGLQSYVCGSGGGSDSSSSRAMIGNVLIIAAQVIVAVQMVVEEKLIGDADLHPMQVVGMEGTFGLSILSLLLVVMYFVPSPGFLCTTAPNCSHFEDSYDAFVNMEHSAPLVLALLGNLLSIAFFVRARARVRTRRACSTGPRPRSRTARSSIFPLIITHLIFLLLLHAPPSL